MSQAQLFELASEAQSNQSHLRALRTSTVEPCLTNNSDSPNCPSILKQPLNSGHPTICVTDGFRGPHCTHTVLHDPDLADTVNLFSKIVHQRS